MTAFAAKLRQLYRVAENFDTGQRRQRTPGDYLSGNQSPARLLVASDRQRNVDDQQRALPHVYRKLSSWMAANRIFMYLAWSWSLVL